MHRHLGNALRTAFACSVLLLGAGCGDRDPDEPTPGTRASQTPAQTPAQTPTQTPTQTQGQTTPPSEGLQKVRVVGVVERTGDCVVVRDDNDITWTIAGADAKDLPAGERVAVTGAPDLAATGCGGPLVRATSVSPLDQPGG
ncbi:hypothetical protein F4692_004096 [Nocardioides cavernae]|uniref:Uncharacterized protein n=1 Tax=Nocardioides cavernae TaxID=1921566 RepID=A0A7Y9H742_9ACTN|nr:hypothetical protein [Nocardioides cavernae]NYE38941.1 hypothetical protein [Nocardioides cavernae]